MSWNIEGKFVVITGASRGIGRETALDLAKRGARLALVVRSRELGEKVAHEIRALGGKDAELYIADLSSQKDIRKVAAEILAKHDKIDVLINNAGVVFMDHGNTVDGYERTFATNHLAYFLLTELLLDAIKKAAPSRIISVSSEAHRRARLDFNDLMAEKSFSGLGVYGRSKLANILFTRQLAKRLEGTGVTANTLHPGVIASQFGSNNKGIFGFLIKLAHPFMSNEADGAKTTIYLATSPDVENVTGKYFNKSREATPTKEAQDDEAAEKLWEVSEHLVAKTA